MATSVLALGLGGGTALAQQGGAGPAPLGAAAGYNPLTPNAAPAAVPGAAAPEGGAFDGLPETDGVELIHGLCGACHSIRLVTQQRVTIERWDYLLDWMVDEQNMPQLPAEDRAIVLTYLARHFSAQR